MNIKTILLFAPLALFLGVGVAASSFYEVSPFREPGHLALQPPEVETLDSTKTISITPFSLTASHRITGSFRILEKDTHTIGYSAQLAPIDFLVGWGKMSDITALGEFSFSVSGRRFSWETAGSHENLQELHSSLALLSVIPANRQLARRLLALRRYDIVSIEGYVVHASHRDGWSFSGRIPGARSQASLPYVLYLERLAVGEPLAQSTNPLRDGFIFRRHFLQPRASE